MSDNLLQIKKHLFLTGDKQVGKSTLLHRLIEIEQLDCAGFETRAFYLNGVRRGFMLHGRVELPPYENDSICCARIAEKQSIPILPVFEENGVKILRESLHSSAPFLLMDELGRLEREADRFITGIFQCLDSEKRVLGVLQKCSSAHVKAIAQRDDVTVLSVTPENREALLTQLQRII